MSRAIAALVLAFIVLPVRSASADSVVVFNEIQYHPWDPGEPEWIELHNQMAVDVDLSGWQLSGGVSYEFLRGTVIAAGGYLLVSSDPVSMGGEALGPWSGRLSNAGERLRLRNNSGRLMDELEFGDRGVWPIGPDGSGATLAKFDQDEASAPPENWRASAERGGTPGQVNFPDASTDSPEFTLVPLDANWRYNESGVELASNWAGTAHVPGEDGWSVGPGLLGFETSPEELSEPLRTVFESPAENPIITYYFETDFELSAAQVAGVGRLLLRHMVDDGAVFYVNGVEAGPRFNMDDGEVGPLTTSSEVVRNAELRGPLELSTASLVAGVNRLSVEVHQQAANSSDIVFGASLHMTQKQAESVPLVISEISGSANAGFLVELANTGTSPVVAGGFTLAARGMVDASHTLPTPLVIEVGGFLVLDEEDLGFRPTDGDRLFLFSANEAALVDAARVDDLPRAWSGRHGRMLIPDAPSWGEPNTFSLNHDVVINEIMYHFREDPGTVGADSLTRTTELIGPHDHWSFNETGEELPPDWAAEAHVVDGLNWRSAPAPIGFELGNLPDPIRTEVASPIENTIVTYYFERDFTLTAGQLQGALSLQLSHLIDDGAVFYLNGVEAARYNLPGGPLTPSVTAEVPIRDARYEGPVSLPTDNLVAGKNRLSVEVHQDAPTSSDVVFGLILNAVEELAPASDPQPVIERDEEWVELHNKGGEVVELTGWSIDGGIDFNFPEGTRIPAGGYLVVARDAGSLRAKYPEKADRILGNYRNRLSNETDLVRLEDALENLVDEVRYFEGGRWPGLADGNGSSLELRDPHADNLNPGAWAASDESGKQGWQTIRYRGRGGQSYGLTNWNEFRLGMLRAGEVLIDDVSVIRDPDGASEELIQNGSFSSGAQRWRILGNHRHSTVINEPGNPGNRVLHLVAVGATDTRHNHLETTFLNNTALQASQEYEVSFRARWLAGSNQVNSRCYYQRLARTTQLERPERAGTPGEENSRGIENLGPTFSNLSHEPPVPAANVPIRVTAEVADPDGLGRMVLKARYNEGSERAFPFVVDDRGQGAGSLPGAAAGTIIQFWVEAEDVPGASSRAPAGGREARALIQVEDGQGTNLPQQELRLIMLPSDRAFLFDTFNLMSNERLGATAIYNGRTITYDVGVRLRGSGAGRARDGTAHRGFSVAFPADQRFRGVHDSIALDRSGRVPAQRRQDEIYVKHMFNHAGVPCMYDDLVYLVGPSPTYSGTALMQMASYGSVFTSSQFENGARGSVFNVDITYDPVTSSGGVEGLKPPVPFTHIGTDFQDRGDSKEDYRTSFEIRTGRRRDDYAVLMEFCKTLSLPAAELDARIDDVMDVDEWTRYIALTVLCGIGDTWVQGGLRHNIRLFAPEAGRGRVVALPWDADILFSTGTTSSMLPMTGNLRRVIDLPRVRRLYWGHVQNLVRRTFSPSYMDGWLEHYGSVMGADLRGQVSYIRARGSYALSQLPAEVPFRVTTQGGNDFSVNATQAVLEGKGWINLREFRLAGRSERLPVEWLDAETWRVTVPLLPGPNAITLEAYGFEDRLLESADLTITSTVTTPQPVEFLRITEIHFNPEGSDATEFVELKNIGSQPLDIGGVRFTEGITFTVPAGVVLGPSGFALVVRDEEGFRSFYGGGLPVIGQFSPTALSNDGERLTLRDRSGNVIHSFEFSDRWYPETDDGGHSLVVRDERAEPALWSVAAGWRPSAGAGGSPNLDDLVLSPSFMDWQDAHFTEEELARPEVSGALGDANGDGMVNLLAYAWGANPWRNVPSSWLPSVELVGDRVRLVVRRRKGAEDLGMVAEFGGDLLNWAEVAVPLGPPVDHGDGTETVVFEDHTAGGRERFGRVRVTLTGP